MSKIIWDGVTRAETVGSEATARQHLADRARGYQWDSVLTILAQHPEWINSARPGSSSRYAVLHQAANGGADSDSRAIARHGCLENPAQREGRSGC